ncbi:MAG: TIGR02391 family protein [Pseudonocardiales bacterium]|nr:TIGR02391 family protein [Pseudonocardiales bacterium]
MMVVIDVIHPHMPGASTVDDHVEVTCVPNERAVVPDFAVPVLHSTMSGALALVERGRILEAVREAMRLVEERVQRLTARGDSGHPLMESVFGARPPRLDITTATGRSARDEQEGFRLLFIGAMLGLRDAHDGGRSVPATVHEVLEYLAFASMLMRRLDWAESRLS